MDSLFSCSLDITDFQLKERKKKKSTKMGEKKPEPLDFVKDFQEYLTQQTHHVNMISGSVSGDKEAETLQGGRLILILLKSSHW